MVDQLLLCTDLDRTLIPNGDAPESPQARELFRRFVTRPEVSLVYVTGRHLDLIETAISEYQLPRPQFAIADVGSSIYTWQNVQWHRWQAWDDHLGTGWPEQGAIALQKFLYEQPNLTLQEPEKQGHYKLSYYVRLPINHHHLIANIQTNLKQSGISSHIIWSVDPEKKMGLLDILPQQANKYQAILFLMQAHNFLVNQTIFAGDSGNDWDVLISPIPAVLVANAHPKLKQQLQDTQNNNQVYFPQGDFLGMNGNYSAGILEGILHYFPHYQNWLDAT
ncbi:haloacid dehalogenase [Synechococcus moorigangaii CMS01]|nr:haloacid dehalogenase [Synechococcus moorigangaii CMS01]